MGSAAISLVILGFAVGAVFRLKILLSILALVLIFTIVFSFGHGFTFLETALIILEAQSIVQASYFLGLVTRAVVAAACRMRPVT
jgi:hypothetical protein